MINHKHLEEACVKLATEGYCPKEKLVAGRSCGTTFEECEKCWADYITKEEDKEKLQVL